MMKWSRCEERREKEGWDVVDLGRKTVGGGVVLIGIDWRALRGSWIRYTIALLLNGYSERHILECLYSTSFLTSPAYHKSSSGLIFSMSEMYSSGTNHTDRHTYTIQHENTIHKARN